MRFRERLIQELERRQAGNRRYSRRAFARFLLIHHATLSRLLHGTHAPAQRTIASAGQRLGLSRREIEEQMAVEAEAAVLELVGRDGFRPDSRWLASAAGIPVDHINVALQSLLRQGTLRMVSAQRWECSRESA